LCVFVRHFKLDGRERGISRSSQASVNHEVAGWQAAGIGDHDIEFLAQRNSGLRPW
jgi:hypothetical protein